MKIMTKFRQWSFVDQAIKNPRNPKLGLILVSLSTVSILLSACSSASSSTSARVSSKSQVTTAAATPTIIWQPGDEQPFYYANGFNLWKKFNVAPKEIEVDAGTAELSAMASGSADFGLFGEAPFISGVAHGIPMVAVMDNVNYPTLEGLYVAPNSGITGLKSLIGKSVAVPFGSSANTGLVLGLEKAGISPSQVTLENDSPNAILAGFVRHSIDAAYIWSTWGQRLLAAGAKLVSSDASEGVNAGPTVLAVLKSYLEQHPTVVADVIAALDEGAVGVTKNPASVAQTLAKDTGDTYQEGITIAKQEQSLTIADALSPSGPASFINKTSGVPALMLKNAMVLKQQGLITTIPSNIPSLVVTRPLKAAEKLIPH